MNHENADRQAREGAGPKHPRRNPGAIGTLLRIGTRRCRLAAAVIVVVAGLVTQTANQALAEAKGHVLYLDAPAVSKDRATRAGEIARAYASPGSAVSPEATPDVLTWLGLGPVRAGLVAPSQDASAAFASVTAPDAEGTPGVTAEAAYAAGETMLAQIEHGAPSRKGSPSESELAAAGGADRPELGDGAQAPKEHPSPDYEAQPAEQPATPELAPSPKPVVPAAGPPAEPTGGEGLALEAWEPFAEPAPAETELAAALTKDASPPPDVTPDDRPDYGPTGPISEPVDDTLAQPEAESESEPSSEMPAKPPVRPTEDSEDGDGELAEAQPTPAVGPELAGTSDGGATEAGANGSASPAPANGPAEEDPAPAPNTGPTGSQGDGLTLVAPSEHDADAEPATSPGPTPEEDLADASLAPGDAATSDGSGADVSEGQLSGVVLRESGTTDRAGASASPPADSSPSAGEVGDGPAEETVPAPSVSPSEEGEPESTAEPDRSSAETDPASGETASGETASSSPEEDAQTSAPNASQATEPDTDLDDEDDLDDAVTVSPAPEETPPEDARTDSGEDGAPETLDGDPQSSSDMDGTTATDDAPARSPAGDAGTEDPLPEPETPTGGGSDGEPERQGEDHEEGARENANDWDERVARGRPGTTGVGEWSERLKDGAGGKEGSHGDTDLEEAEERSFEGSWAKNRPTSTVKTAPARLAKEHEAWRAARREARLAKRRTSLRAAAERSARQAARRERAAYRQRAAREATAALRADPSAQRPETRRAEIFAARAAERKDKQRANRLAVRRATMKQAAVERAARHASRGPAHTDPASTPKPVPESVAPPEAAPVARNRSATARRDTVARPLGTDLAPVRQVQTRRHATVEQPPPVQHPPARQVPAARLVPNPQVQPQVRPPGQPPVQPQVQPRQHPGPATRRSAVVSETGAESPGSPSPSTGPSDGRR
jgi:hypothetical protein